MFVPFDVYLLDLDLLAFDDLNNREAGEGSIP